MRLTDALGVTFQRLELVSSACIRDYLATMVDTADKNGNIYTLEKRTLYVRDPEGLSFGGGQGMVRLARCEQQ